MAVVESVDSMNPLILNPLLGENYELTLKQSIENLQVEIGKGNHALSHFTQRFYELMQARVDAPMESIWFYTALTFHSRRSTRGDLLDRVDYIKDLFQLVCSCSASCGSSKTIALFAPVVFEVHEVIAELVAMGLSSNRERKAMKEVKILFDAILGYIVLCSRENFEPNGELVEFSLNTAFTDLIYIWTYPNKEIEDFLPLLSDGVCRGLSSGVFDVRHLAGAVIAEVFMLKLFLNFRSRRWRQDLEKNLRMWAVFTISGIKNIYFFETLVKIQLEGTLPMMSLLDTEDEVLLMRVLYDALILVDYSFLDPEKAINLPAEHVTLLAVKRLILVHEAIEFFRENGDQSRAIFYLNEFSSSLLSSQIIKWIRSQIPSIENVNPPNGLSPKLLIEWLLKAEDQGIRVFDDSDKLVLNVSTSDPECTTSEGNKVEDDLFFYIDNQGEKANEDSEDKVLDEPVMSMKENGSGKQKRRRKAERKNKMKCVKHELVQDSNTAALSSDTDNNDSNSDCEDKNLYSDEDTDTKE